jgi:SAM-dependent MidA family methyltransferase
MFHQQVEMTGTRIDGPVRWRQAMESALYGPDGFFSRAAPGDHFRTSAVASPAFAAAILRLVVAADDALGRPARLDVVDIGAGRGELLSRLAAQAPAGLRRRLAPAAVELAPLPIGLAQEIEWTDRVPAPRSLTGVLLATEWLDNVPLDIASRGADGVDRYVTVDPLTGIEYDGEPVSATDAQWISRWYGGGSRFELGGPRDSAWAGAVAALARGVAITVDYGHTKRTRPPLGTLTAFRSGRELSPVPDGSRDITAHVAIDAVRAAGEAIAGMPAILTTQRKALTALGVRAVRPSLALATEDPARYLRALAEATEAAELAAEGGLGDHFWLVQPVGIRRGTFLGESRQDRTFPRVSG